MKRIISLFIALAAASLFPMNAQDVTSEGGIDPNAAIPGPYSQIMNASERQFTDLCGTWKAIVDQYDNGYFNYRMMRKEDEKTFFADEKYFQNKTKLIEYDFDMADELTVPGDWNTQNPMFLYYEGSIWYRKTFNAAPKPGKRYFVWFGAANYEAIVGFNGVLRGRHIGGFTPFNFEVTGSLRSGLNSLVVKVNNSRHKDAIPTLNCDWWNYGGITREVRLLEVPSTFIREHSVTLSADGKSIEGWVQLDGPAATGQKVEVSIPELKFTASAVADASGKASFCVKAKPELWSPESPKLYDVRIASGEDSLGDRIGFKTIKADGRKLLLNGKEIFCKGIAIHEEQIGAGGRAWSEAHSRALLQEAKDLGCNFVRLAHYPHNDHMTRLADEMGLMVWSEVPVYWTISWTNPATYANARNQVREMITRDRNRASIIIWSVANETPRSPERLKFLSGLIDTAREMDATRLVSAAMEKRELPGGVLTVDDDLLSKADLISFNQYVGWYDGDVEKCRRVKWTFPVEKPIIITELGAGVKAGYHGAADERFTEEYAVELYKAQIEMLEGMPWLNGVAPWILKDFRSPRRQLNIIQGVYNRKGLLSETGEKKECWQVLHDWYNKK